MATTVRWLGPGSLSNAVDGYYVRVFGETGLLGIALFAGWIIIALRTLKQRSIGKFSLVMLAIAAFFIDIFSSSKVMPILWVFLALEHAGHPFAFRSARPLFRRTRRLLPELGAVPDAASGSRTYVRRIDPAKLMSIRLALSNA